MSEPKHDQERTCTCPKCLLASYKKVRPCIRYATIDKQRTRVAIVASELDAYEAKYEELRDRYYDTYEDARALAGDNLRLRVEMAKNERKPTPDTVSRDKYAKLQSKLTAANDELATLRRELKDIKAANHKHRTAADQEISQLKQRNTTLYKRYREMKDADCEQLPAYDQPPPAYGSF